jgi:CubicO group peptidase (beta-lactamase class C family)
VRILTLYLLLAVTGIPIAAASDIRERVADTLERQNLTGAVWATVDQAGKVSTGAAGLKDVRLTQALKPTDRVQVGSVAKTVLATGIFRLISLGKVSLDDPVSSLLPDVVFDNPWAATDPVRLRHLLDQTSGLDDARLWQVFSAQSTPDTPLSKVFDRDPTVLRIRSRPGSRFSYSNMGYTLAGRVIEAVTGQRYEDYLDQYLLLPLGMRGSTFTFLTQEGPSADPLLAMGHFENGIVQPALPMYLRPAGQFATTAADMGRFARFLMGDGRVLGRMFIDPALLRAMGRSPGTEASRAGLIAGYGLGMYTRDRNGAVGSCHGGSTLGYRAMLCVFPEMHRAFFYSINTDSESADRDALDRLLLEELNMPSPEPLKAGIQSSDLSAWAGYYVPSPNRFASFAWIDTVFNFVSVQPDKNGLDFKPFLAPALLLEPMGGHLFRAPNRRAASHALLLSVEGDQVITTGSQSFVKVSKSFLLFQWVSLVLGLFGIIWLLLMGIPRLLAGRLRVSNPCFAAALGIMALLLPLPFYLTQSILQLGDLTVASGLVAVVTLLFPISMMWGLRQHWLQRPGGVMARLDMMAMLFVLQFTFVLAGWNLLPLRLWV